MPSQRPATATDDNIIYVNPDHCDDVSFSLPQCRQLVAVCDEILNSSPETLLTHTAQLESVDLVPVSPGDQLVRPVLTRFPGTLVFTFSSILQLNFTSQKLKLIKT